MFRRRIELDSGTHKSCKGCPLLVPESRGVTFSPRDSLRAWIFVVGLVLMVVGTVTEELALSREQYGVVSSPLPIGLVAAIVTGITIGLLTKDPEVSVFRAFVAGYIGAILGAAVFAALYWGRSPEAGFAGWTVFFVGGLFVGVAIGWINALASAGSAYIAALYARSLGRHRSASAR